MKRLFVGIPLSFDLKREIEPFLTELKLPGISPVAVENLHLTIKFLGEVEEEKILEISEKLSQLASLTPSFPVELKGIGVFPDLKQPRVVWIGTESKELVRLMRTVDKELDYIRQNEHAAGIPHLTLARIKSTNEFLLRSFLHRHSNQNWGTLKVDRICLYEATLTPIGPIYAVLSENKLKMG
ncbi:MAG: RNA 2',3'-cyclic phosphodiesterase [Candidatus Woesearchaeota archaeon]